MAEKYKKIIKIHAVERLKISATQACIVEDYKAIEEYNN